MRNKLSAKDYIKNFGLQKHIEGGYYGVVYKANDMVIPINPRYKSKPVSNGEELNGEKNTNEQRSAGTSIYFLLDGEDFSAWHKLKSDEIWHYYDGGSPIDIHVIDEDRHLKTYSLGNPSITEGTSFQVVIKAGAWFAAEVKDKTSFSLVGCTVAPGFEFQDFTLGNIKKLLPMYPEHTNILKRLSRMEPEQTKKSFNYNSEISININEDGSIFILDKKEELNFDEINKPSFFNHETGESVIEYSGLATDNNEVRSWAKACYTENGFSEKHYHNDREEIYYIISGRAKIVIDDQEQILEPGDSVTIHPKQNHQVFSIDIVPLELIAKCSPSWMPSDQNIVN